MSYGTAEELELDHAQIIEAMEQFNVGTLDIVPFAVFHDSKEPLGFLIKSRVDGDVLAFATDTVNLRYKFPGLNILAIEANYERAVLDRSEKLPEKTKDRITKAPGEIDTLRDYLRTWDLWQCKERPLRYLSDAMSRESEFISRVRRVVPPQIEIKVCAK